MKRMSRGQKVIDETRKALIHQIMLYEERARQCFKDSGPGSCEGLYWQNLSQGISEAVEILLTKEVMYHG